MRKIAPDEYDFYPETWVLPEEMTVFTKVPNETTQSAPVIDWASLGRSEFDLPGTCVGASWSRPDTLPIINLDTLGKSELAMPGDDADLAMNAIAPRANRKKKKKRSKSNRAAHSYVS